MQSGADLMTANTLDGMHDWAFVGAGTGGYSKVPRAELSARILERMEKK